MADALDSGSSECKFMWVQVPSPAPNQPQAVVPAADFEIEHEGVAQLVRVLA